ncbi:hypothetical protein Aduo_001835 [Ancylostoma duodenale]
MHAGQNKSIPLTTTALNFYYGRLTDGDAEAQKLFIDSSKRDIAPIVHRTKAIQDDANAVVNWALNEDSEGAITDACIVLLSFLAFLRIGETAGIRKRHLEDKGSEAWWLHIPRSKTDQCAAGATIAFKVQGRDKILWYRFMQILATQPRDQFVFGTTAGSKPTTDALRKRLNTVLISADFVGRA